MYTHIVLVTLFVCASALPQYEIINPNDSWRIVGGFSAASGQFPFIASMRNAANHHFCGSSIISSRWVLTAAHCVVGSSISGMGIVVGTHLLNSGGTRHAVSRTIHHAGYNSNTYQNDIAVAQTASKISFGNLVQQTSLSTASTGGGVPCTLIGWGRLSSGGSIPNNLQWLGLNTMTVAQCQRALSPDQQVSASQICAVIGSGRGACMGDSGGPLILNSNGAQIGLASWVIIPCGVGYPDGYTRVSSYISWIQKAVNG